VSDKPTFHIGSVSGGQNDFGGHDNTFNQVNQLNQGTDAAAVAGLLSRLRTRLDDFADPRAAEQALEIVEQEPRGGRAQHALQELMSYVRPGTEALTAMTALVAAVRGVVG